MKIDCADAQSRQETPISPIDAPDLEGPDPRVLHKPFYETWTPAALFEFLKCSFKYFFYLYFIALCLKHG
jgi:hypothetical protein